MEYDDPPRGRVVCDKVTRRFCLYADACILGNDDLMAKIRRQLNLPAEIEVGPDNFYQCKKCLGLSTEDVAGLNAKGRQKHGFGLDRKSYVHHLAFIIMEALWCHFKGQRRQEGAIGDVNPLRDNEVRRIADLQVPSWISVAPANGRFSRARAAEQAIARVETVADFLAITRKRKGRDLNPAVQASVEPVPVQRTWDFAITAIARQLAKPSNEVLLPDRDAAEANFFSMVRRVCRSGKKANRP
jgi:hypothetical protein